MRQAFVIDGQRTEIRVIRSRWTTELHEVAPVGGAWMGRVPTGDATVHLTGVLADGSEIDGAFAVLGKEEDGTIVLMSEPYERRLGSREES